MSQKEAKRGQVLDLLMANKINQIEAAKHMEITVRQTRRLAELYQVRRKTSPFRAGI